MSGALASLIAVYKRGTQKVGSVSISNSGRYNPTPSAVTFTGGGGNGAAATISAISAGNIQTGSVTNIFGSQTGGYYTMTSSAPTVSFSAGGGSSATATANFGSGKVIRITGPARTTSVSGSLTFSGGGGSGAAANFVGYAARITYSGLNVTNNGSGYTSAPTVSFSGGPSVVNNYPTATANISGGQVVSISFSVDGDQVVDQYSDFYQLPNISITGGGGSGATATWGNNTVVNIIDYWAVASTNTIFTPSNGITNTGSGYTSAPTVTVPNLVTGSLTAEIGREVSSITLNTGGSGYYGSPYFNLALSGGTAVSGFSPSHNWYAGGDWYDYSTITLISVTNGGTGYTGVPTVGFTGGGVIVPAVATANMIPE